jgi:uncharacterized protein with LGFP repeats
MSAIDDKYAQLGGAQSFLGQATTPEHVTPNGLGSFRHFQGGSIYWNHTMPIAFEVHGLIRGKWAELGWENFLGFPVTDELPVAGGRGRASDFERGVIAWTPQTGAHEVHGAILRRWITLGRENGLGFPLTDELTTPDTRGRYNHFENGSIYWTPQTGAQEVTGVIKNTWAGAGWERGPLGYPTSPPNRMQPSTNPTTFQDFEGGSMYEWAGITRTVLRQPSVAYVTGTMIDWHHLSSLLPDNDRISVAFTGHRPDGTIRLTLNAGPGISWWKGIRLWSPSQGDLLQEAWTENNHTSTTISIPPAELEPSNRFLLFKKAKAFGAHTGIYWLGRVDRMLGNDVTFTWLQDRA